jgi:RWD domain
MRIYRSSHHHQLNKRELSNLTLRGGGNGLNEIAAQEVEALEAIYGPDFATETKLIQHAWKAAKEEMLFKIRLSARTETLKDSVIVYLCFKFTEDYPLSSPILDVRKVTGLNDNQIQRLQKLVNEKAAALVGMEMIYDLATLVEDYVTDHNSVIGEMTSMHDRLELMNRTKVEKEMQDNKLEAIEKQKRLELADLHLMALIQEEVTKKELLLTQAEAPESNAKANVNPVQVYTIREVQSSPAKVKGNIELATAWSSDGSTFTLLKMDIRGKGNMELLKSNLETYKTLTHAGLSTLEDYEIKTGKKPSLEVLIKSNLQSTLTEMINISGSFEIFKANTVICDLLSAFDELQSVGMRPKIVNSDLVYFRDDLTTDMTVLLLDSLASEGRSGLNSHIPWQAPDAADICLWYIGALLLQMVFGRAIQKYPLFKCISIGKCL